MFETTIFCWLCSTNKIFWYPKTKQFSQQIFLVDWIFYFLNTIEEHCYRIWCSSHYLLYIINITSKIQISIPRLYQTPNQDRMPIMFSSAGYQYRFWLSSCKRTRRIQGIHGSRIERSKYRGIMRASLNGLFVYSETPTGMMGYTHHLVREWWWGARVGWGLKGASARGKRYWCTR